MRGLVVVVVMLAFSSCTNNNLMQKPSVLGKWSVVSDSLNFGGAIRNYSTSSSDYYEFLSNNSLIISEGNRLDTADYAILYDTAITITFKRPPSVTFLVIQNGLVVKDSIQNRFSQRFSLKQFSPHQLLLSTSFSYPLAPMTESPTKNTVLVTGKINLKR
ncbi:MAG TPA: hypothetical protein VL728_04380 [Cyclobacteriaceae bacterium]|jgi:hypothetical protein|nr:hypothetical protein [Cyclobacteriaceae bacterium]